MVGAFLDVLTSLYPYESFFKEVIEWITILSSGVYLTTSQFSLVFSESPLIPMYILPRVI